MICVIFMLLTHGNQEICSSYQMDLPFGLHSQKHFLAAGFCWTQQSSVHHRDPRTCSTPESEKNAMILKWKPSL